MKRWRMLCEAENITHPVLLYHVANTEDRQSIMQHGLLRSKSWDIWQQWKEVMASLQMKIP